MATFIIIPDSDVNAIESVLRQDVKMDCLKTIDGKNVVPVSNMALFSDLLSGYDTIELSNNDFVQVNNMKF
jgi:hypothetical protein